MNESRYVSPAMFPPLRTPLCSPITCNRLWTRGEG